MTILLVEDEALVGLAESRALTNEGYEVIHVLSGVEAVNFFREKKRKADLILMDIDLGEGMDGTAAAQEILRDYDIPVVFLSSHTEKEIVEKTEKITSYGYVVKNTGITVLTASIKMAAKLHEAHCRLKEDERIIRESERRYRATFETTGAATVILQENTIISFANREFERLSGYSKEEIEGKMSWTKTALKEDLDRMLAMHWKRREDGNDVPREYEFRFVKKSGEIRNILLHVDVIPGTKESIASLTDITDLGLAEQAAEDQKNFLQVLIDSIPDPIFYKDSSGINQGCNTAFEKFIGKSKQEIIRKTVFDIYPKDLAEQYRAKDSELLANPGIQSYESRVEHADGTRHDVVFNKATYKNKDGTVGGIIGILHDITERKMADEELRASEERYRKLAENAGESIVVAQGQMLKYVNPITSKLTGFSMEEMYTKPFIEFIHPDDRVKVAENYRARLEGRQAFSSYEFRMLTRDGNFRWVEINVVEITWEGAPATLNFFKDFTERKLIEERLEKSLMEKDLLMRELQHRVKNNLNVVSGLLSLEMDNLSDETAREVFRNAQSRINSMSVIYERLNRSANVTRVDLAPYVRDLIAMLAETYLMDSEKVRITVDIQEVSLDMKRAVPLGLIINELISNAIKYAYPAGNEGDITIDLKVRRENIDLSVADNGVGFPAGFDPLKSESMGLHLVRMLANQIGGRIEFGRGPGSAVLISFPLQPADSQSNAYPSH